MLQGVTYTTGFTHNPLPDEKGRKELRKILVMLNINVKLFPFYRWKWSFVAQFKSNPQKISASVASAIGGQISMFLVGIFRVMSLQWTSKQQIRPDIL